MITAENRTAAYIDAPHRSSGTVDPRAADGAGAAGRPVTGPVAPDDVPDGEFWARFFPALAPGEDTVFYDVTRAPEGLHLRDWQDRDRACRDWFWVVWWRGRPQLHSWADTETDAVHTAVTSTTYGPVIRHPGPAARYLAAWST